MINPQRFEIFKDVTWPNLSLPITPSHSSTLLLGIELLRESEKKALSGKMLVNKLKYYKKQLFHKNNYFKCDCSNARVMGRCLY